MATKNRITVNLDDDEYKALLDVATKADRSLAWLGRFAICNLLLKGEQTSTPDNGQNVAGELNTGHSTQ